MRKHKRIACVCGILLGACVFGGTYNVALSTPSQYTAKAETSVFQEVADDALTLAPVEDVYGMTADGFRFADSTTAYGNRPFKENTLYQFRFSIDEKGSSNQLYSFAFAGGGVWDSYAFHLNYKTGNIGYGASIPLAEKNTVEFGLTYGEIYSVQLAAISLYDKENFTDETLPVGERIIIKISNEDGSKKKEIAQNYVGDENRSAWANKYGEGSVNPTRSIGSTLNLYVNNMTGFEAKMYAFDKNNTIYFEMADEDMPIVYLEELMPMNATYPIENQSQGKLIFQPKKWIEFKIRVDEKGTWNGKFILAFAGGGTWNSYAVCLDYIAGTIGLGNSPTAAQGTVNAKYPAIKEAWGKTFTVRLGLMGIYNNEELTGNRIGERMLFFISDGENSAQTSGNFVKENRCGYVLNTEANPTGGYGSLLGTYINNPTEFKGMFLPVEYKRQYNVTVEYDGGYEFKEITYGDTYDFTSKIPTKPYYTLTGLTGEIDGAEQQVALSGIWTTDITVPEADGSYETVLTPVYTAVEYDVNYVVEHATVGNANPLKITADDGVVQLKSPETIENGYAFLGWYTDAACTNKVDEISVTGENITLHGKTAKGYTLTLVYPDGTSENVGVNEVDTYVFPTTKIEGYEAISGWKTQNGTPITQVKPTKNETYYAVAKPIEYSITYVVDGGTNDTENPTVFTLASDTITLKNATKDGYVFVGWYNEDGENVKEIVKGTKGNLTLNALFAKDTFPTEQEYVQSSIAQNIPLVNLPFASYSVSLQKENDTQVAAVEDGKATFDTLGKYVLTYTITLPSGELVKKITVQVVVPTITVNGTYAETYTAGETLTLLPAETNALDGTVTTTIKKDGVAIDAASSILLETGTYTITYTLENIETKTFTFTVTAKAQTDTSSGSTANGGCGSTLTGGASMLGIVTLLGGAVAVCKKRKQ